MLYMNSNTNLQNYRWYEWAVQPKILGTPKALKNTGFASVFQSIILDSLFSI